jgi:hypothetical protein
LHRRHRKRDSLGDANRPALIAINFQIVGKAGEWWTTRT